MPELQPARFAILYLQLLVTLLFILLFIFDTYIPQVV